MLHIAVINHSTVISDAEIKKCLPAFQKQLDRDFAPAWGICAKLHFGIRVIPHTWVLGVFDDADQAGALGYHDVSSLGTPLGKVFAKTTMDDGGLWTVTFTHELLEMLVDPWIVASALDDQRGRFYALEICDAVEADRLGYDIDGVRVTDFVLPGFFEASIDTGEKLSFCGHVSKPYEIAPGGYLSYLDLGNIKAGWQQDFARRPGTSRHARRRSVK